MPCPRPPLLLGNRRQVRTRLTKPRAQSTMKIDRHPVVDASAEPRSGERPGLVIRIKFINDNFLAASAPETLSRTIARPKTRPAHPPNAWKNLAVIKA